MAVSRKFSEKRNILCPRASTMLPQRAKVDAPVAGPSSVEQRPEAGPPAVLGLVAARSTPFCSAPQPIRQPLPPLCAILPGQQSGSTLDRRPKTFGARR